MELKSIFNRSIFMPPKHVYVIVFFLTFIAACGSGKAILPAGEKPRSGIKTQYKAPSIAERNSRQTPLTEPKGTITFRDALSLALMNNPEIFMAEWQVRIKDTGIRQSGLRPNPEMDFAAEQFGGVGPRREFEGAEITFRLSQLIELGGKRAARIRESKFDHETALWEYEIIRMDVLTGVTRAYIELLASQEKSLLARETVNLAENFARAAHERLLAGKVPPIEEAKAKVSLSLAKIKQNQKLREIAVARKNLAAFWGGKEPVFEKVSGVLDSLVIVPPPEDVIDALEKNPDLQRWTVKMKLYSSRVDLQKKRRIPDITVSGGAGRYMDDRSTAYLMEFSLPLPLFDHNQWNHLQAEQERSRALEEQRLQEVQLNSSFFKAYRELASSCDNALVLIKEIIPNAQKTLDDANEGYRQGKFSYLDVLEAQRTYFETREQGIDTLVSYHIAVAEVERLAGIPLQDLLSKKR
jgi:outer membrane protein, heavy metal efflux system